MPRSLTIKNNTTLEFKAEQYESGKIYEGSQTNSGHAIGDFGYSSTKYTTSAITSNKNYSVVWSSSSSCSCGA